MRLKYPVALLTADEVIYAGGKYSSSAPIYLYTKTYNWLMTAGGFDGSANELILDWGRVTYKYVDTSDYRAYGVFPAVSLSSDTLIEDGGDGTINNPYVIKVK